MSKYSVSVGIVFYNPSKKNIQQNIIEAKNIIDKSKNEVTFYFVDNGSTVTEVFDDNEMPSGVHLLRLESNLGFGGGHNQILNSVNSDVHIVMNPDIHLADVAALDMAINYLMEHKVSLISPQLKSSNGEIQLLNRLEPTVFDLAIRFLGSSFLPNRQAGFVKKESGYDGTIQHIENATGAFMIMKTLDLKKIGGFDERYFMYMEDTDLTKSVNTFGNGALYYPSLVLEHGWQRDNHSLKGSLRMINSMIKYFNKWGWKLV